jgi:nucleoside-diphosphate-sugar epimerase
MVECKYKFIIYIKIAFMPKNIFITGVAGFIGSSIAKKQLEKGYSVIGIDNLNNYYSPVVKLNNLKRLNKYSNFKFSKCDINKEEDIDNIVKENKPDYIVHCAALAGVRASAKRPLSYYKTNINGTANILEAIRVNMEKSKVILLSSSSIYGIQENVPFTEKMIPNPLSPYGSSKAAMETVAKNYADFFGMKIAVIRPFSIYGPCGRPDMAPFLAVMAAEKGEIFEQFGTSIDNARDWTYIDDFTNGVMLMIENHDFQKYEVFNFGSSKPIGIDEFTRVMAKYIKKYLKKDLIIKKTKRASIELPITFANIELAKQKFGFSPTVSFEEGIKNFLEYYKNNRHLYKI